MSNVRLEGGCQCGAVRYHLSAPPAMVYACHCTICRRISTSAFNISVIVDENTLHIDQGTLGRLDWTAHNDIKRYGEFCVTCGGRIRHGHTPSQGIFVLRGGTLDDQRWARPAAHIWLDDALPWFTPPEDDLHYAVQPVDYTPIIDLYAERIKDF